MLTVSHLRCEYRINPIGLDITSPRLSWHLQSDHRNCVQSDYQIQLSRTEDFAQIEWDSGKKSSDQSIHVELEHWVPEARTRYYYRIRAWERAGDESDWSETAYFETGFMGSEDAWQAEWITVDSSSQQDESCPRLRTLFELKKPIASARIYVTALGLYELHLNNQRVGKAYFTPGWTSYSKRLQYQVYDVTDQLQNGQNILGAYLGDGWYKGYLGWEKKQKIYGTNAGLLLELHIHYTDGSEEHIISDRNWKSSPSAIRSSDIYMGETYDARMESEWQDSSLVQWSPVGVLNYSKEIIIAQENVPVTPIEQIKPIALFTTPLGERVLDMGQNMVGWVRFSIQGETGHSVELLHAEILDHQGNFYTENLRGATQCIRYTLKGAGVETYEPRFTFQGFRYVKLIGFPEEIRLEDFTGVVLHSNMERTGDFKSSSPLVNQLHHNILWGQKGNFVDVPTDCPQRDERLGWTGDAQMFIRTSSYLMNTAPFFTKWLRDLQADQGEDGGIPFYVPDLKSSTSDGWADTNHSSAAWGDAAVICPWTIYEMYGDVRLLAEQYDSMKRWINYIHAQGENPYLWNTGFHFGDWLGLDSKPDSYIGATDKEFVATAFYAYSVSLTRKAAEVLGQAEDVTYYDNLHDNIVVAFQNEFVTPAGKLAVPTQTAHVLALHFDLLDSTARKRTIDQLGKLVADAGNHLTTGFVGTPYLNPVLSDTGHHDLAYTLLFQEDYPSWLYQVTQGATTVWEHWDGIREDGSLWSADMNSFNHYAYGAIGEWLYRYVAGINTDEQQPGFRIVHIEPKPGPGLEWVEASFETMYGSVTSNWYRRDNNEMEVRVTIPANTTGTVLLPGADVQTVLENGKAVDQVADIHEIEAKGSDVRIALGSGSYQFTYKVIQADKEVHAQQVESV
ncbi:alpha-L-rhamnosidase [Paenibacillus sp. ALJ109b]|uniref:alpha-L-rhamnosidase n=1 Tax=Paenibacillus sp. ALJ109b TaxID=2709068 RepID=UPI0013D1FDB3|nr:alpha-L-rhamnosidase [Paenibacillus sp. ALJ109b]NEU63503.1 family 78 glycoside hydrolase catalytic domain [Paenibacillus sp. ALJ109b]